MSVIEVVAEVPVGELVLPIATQGKVGAFNPFLRRLLPGG